MRCLFLCFLLSLGSALFAQENTSFLCADGIDNDNDGLIDCDDPDCDALPNNGCAVCPNGLSFADVVLLFDQNCGNQVGELENSLGVADWSEEIMINTSVLSLGKGGTLRLGFTNNQMANSGSNAPDLWVFEVGTAAERTSVALRPVNASTRSALISAGHVDEEGDGYYTVGLIAGSTTAFDVDAVVPGFEEGALRFDAVQLQDDQAGDCAGAITGADIDAVCALSTLPPVDCRGVAGGTALLDACGVCLEPDDPAFNQSCADCAGVPNGLFVIDSCGTCLSVSSPDFNAACTDCAGVLNGTSLTDRCGLCLLPEDPRFNRTCFDCLGVPGGLAVVDSCGVCQSPSNPNFNKSCLDCAGVPNGLAVYDDCGFCLIPTDSTFNQRCADEEPLFVPNGFSPNGDGINDTFRVFKSAGIRAQVQGGRIYDRWGGMVKEFGQSPFTDHAELWDGKDAASGVYVYVIEIRYQRGTVKTLRGLVTLMR
ncbi:gliding motility-associated C-terminal domain-containing protein [Neolewinella aurantiaca]|uniref:Gliding motility-associated C-terminal domain-containing protein n=1 Tax=Neolewinella aurantiaca TaxID=2602767 RepID=A0A5C7G0K2_9BACT|nr:gliding motility-associated C-terminal domain-containing protein [Neolewinella aurantiaca]TXF91245.1 gliding motility-associated C-terminal domain-containing protein [Neolewinella aurantiaca]